MLNYEQFIYQLFLGSLGYLGFGSYPYTYQSVVVGALNQLGQRTKAPPYMFEGVTVPTVGFIHMFE